MKRKNREQQDAIHKQADRIEPAVARAFQQSVLLARKQLVVTKGKIVLAEFQSLAKVLRETVLAGGKLSEGL